MYNNETNERFATLPIPYEKGWTVYINGKKSEVLQANYAFMGLSLKEGINTIELVYYPPYFFLSLFITIVSFITGSLLVRRKKSLFLKLSFYKVD